MFFPVQVVYKTYMHKMSKYFMYGKDIYRPMPIIIALIILVGSSLIVFILMLIKTILGPRKIDQLIDLLNQNKTGLVIKFAKKNHRKRTEKYGCPFYTW